MEGDNRRVSEVDRLDCRARIELLLRRRSVRAFRADPVPADLVSLLMEAAMAAPSACNEQPWRFLLVDDPMLLKQLGEKHPFGGPAKHAPLCIVPCCDLELVTTLSAGDFWVQDMSAATQNLLLAATALGLGAVWIGTYPDMSRVEAIRPVLGLPQHILPLCLVPVGYPRRSTCPHQGFDSERVHRNRFAPDGS